MGIRADHRIACDNESFFRQQGVLDAHLSHIIEIHDAVLVCKFAHQLALLRRLDVFIRCKVVHHKGDLVLIENLFSGFVKCANSRTSLHCSAALMSLFGVKWSITRAILF